ncbi:hypothetical protein [Halosegnis marinus]|uniref:Uncharacterized protein n=1 Tax=Halosegnis marinus TaxID=3034023 RepID=A0ABD5ZQU0_9EURY|nr:hypothetical protein [Halosegnis sp. DT85]
MALSDNLVVLLVSLFVGGIGIYVGASVLASARSYTHAVVTAGVGAIVWSVVGGLFGGIPLLGPAVTLLAYLLVIKWRYGVGWLLAGGIAVVAWVAAVVVLSLLASVGATDLSAVGIPSV